MRFQERDGKLLGVINDYDGVLARRHLKEMFWPGASLRVVQRRISILVEHSYLSRPTKIEWRTRPIPEAIYWLGWKGAIWLAAQRGIDVKPPENEGENQMRRLQRVLREQGFYWMREPRWSRLLHDLTVIDFRLMLEKSVANLPSINIEHWALESEFRSDMDKVEFRFKDKDGNVKQGKRGVCPDFFFVIADEERKRSGEFYRLPLLLEIDMGSHPVSSRFRRQKAAPYAAYLQSPAYQDRFGFNTGAWLIVTSGEQRMRNLLRQTEEALGRDAKCFFFARFSDVKENILSAPVWHQAGRSEPRSILSI